MQRTTYRCLVNQVLVAIILIVSSGSLRAAETNYWTGANTATGTAAKTLVDDITNWSLGRVPGVGNDDVAWFGFYGVNEADLYIAATNVFTPSSIIFEACAGATSWYADMDIYLDKSLTLDRLVCKGYGATGGGGPLFFDRFRIGTMTTSNITVTLSGDGNALDMTAGCVTPPYFRLGSGVGNVLVDFKGTNIVFSKGQQIWRDYADNMAGGTQVENASNTANSTVRFSTPNANIDLEDQGPHASNLGLGLHNWEVRSDQVWTADPTAYVHLTPRNKNASGTAPLLVKSIGGGRLDNLDQINFVVARTDTSAMSIPGGTYGSLNLYRGNTSNRDASFTLLDDVRFVGNAVVPPTATIPAQTNAYSVMLRSAIGSLSKWSLVANGNDLTLDNGLWLYDETSSYCLIDAIASGSTVTVGGNVRIESKNSPWIVTNGTAAARSLGIRGDATTIFRLKGNYENKCRSLYDANNTLNKNFSASTVELIGGAAVKTWEVGDAETLTGVQKNSFSIGNLKVGNTTDTGNVQLVNNHLNDNPVTVTNSLDLVGEKLIVGTLAVGAESKLDINAQVVEVGSSLSIGAGGVLDLNTGIRFSTKQRVENMYGLGNQTAAWNAASASVVDSDNIGTTFTSVYDSGANKTYWTVQSLGGGMVIIVR